MSVNIFSSNIYGANVCVLARQLQRIVTYLGLEILKQFQMKFNFSAIQIHANRFVRQSVQSANSFSNGRFTTILTDKRAFHAQPNANDVMQCK